MNPKEINERLVAIVETVASFLLPNGKREGNNWCAGSIGGEPGHSLKVCIGGNKAGIWSDFSTESKGGDLLELWQQVKGISFIDALAQAKDFAGIVDSEPSFYPDKKRKKPVEKPDCKKPETTVLSWFSGRRISQGTLDSYKIGQQGTAIVFPFLAPDGRLELVKFRDIESEKKTGKKKIWSNSDPDYHLFGWQSITDNDRFAVITEGEIDCCSYHEQGIPALSIPQGAGSGDKQQLWIQNDFERLERFETIYVSMDMDAPGQQAIKSIIDALGTDRCRVVDLGAFKDANEAHCEGVSLKTFLDQAKTKDPDELRSLSEYHEAIMKDFEGTGVTGAKLPWVKTHGVVRLRQSEISLWAGVNSHGKSVLLSNVAVDCIAQGERFCIASMEMKPEKLGRKMYQQICGADMPSRSVAGEILKFVDDSVWIFSAYGTAKADRILEVFKYARRRYGVTHFIVDSLAKCGFGEDDYNRQKDFVDRLMEFAGEFNCHVHLVVHIRKLSDETKIPGKMDVKGTGAITDMVDNVFIAWRNKPKEEKFQIDGIVRNEEPDTVLNCVKQRETGEEPMMYLYFHRPSCQFLGHHEDPPKEYLYLERR